MRAHPSVEAHGEGIRRDPELARPVGPERADGVRLLPQHLSRGTAAAGPAPLEASRAEELEQGKARRRQRLEKRRGAGDAP